MFTQKTTSAAVAVLFLAGCRAHEAPGVKRDDDGKVDDSSGAKVVETAIPAAEGTAAVKPTAVAPKPAAKPSAAPEPATSSGFHDAVREAKRSIILQAFREAWGSHGKAAKALGVNRTYLSRLIRNLDLRDEIDAQRP